MPCPSFLRLVLLSLLLLGRVLLGPDPALAQAVSSPTSAEEAIAQAELPWRDLRELAVRLKGVPREDADPVVPASPPERQVGDRDTFWVADEPNDSYYAIGVTLKVVTPHAYMYLADDTRVELSKLEEAASFFEQRIYDVNRGYFGSETAVGIDGDPRVSIVNATVPGLGGYFTSVDEYTRSVHPYSNERKAIYVNVQSVPPGSPAYYGVLAHEFEHMIHSNTNRREQTWVKEGAAEVAVEAANLGSSGAASAFESTPDTQLDAWADSKGDVGRHYGAAYLFLSYFLEHFGGYQVAADLLSGTTRGRETFDQFLASQGYGLSFEDVFRDWVVANYLDETGVRDPRYRYGRLRVRVPATDRLTSSVDWQDRTVRQFAADYLELGGRWSSARIRFQGEPTARVIPAEARSGRSFWWSNRGDLIDTTLTRPFDLRGLTTATLSFSAWYDLEDGYDYAYVAVSRDCGRTWTTLPTENSTTENPNGNNLGNGFTGKSGGGERARWIEQTANLSPYAGETVLVRFEKVTDDAYNSPGFAVDDISVPELGYSSDAEQDDGGWDATGFVRTDGRLSQRYSLQLIRFEDGIRVEQVPLSPSQEADLVLENPGGRPERAVLVVSGLTGHTTEPASYRYAVEMTP